MREQPFISICIPVYKEVSFLKRLLKSIQEQTYKNFEVVVTDDTPDNSVGDFLQAYDANFEMRYVRNEPSLGTPENWNSGMRLAAGAWIKIMHGDDWFASPDSLLYFANATKDTSSRFIFCGYQNVFEATGKKEVHQLGLFHKYLIKKSRLNLFKANYIGNPSCTMIKGDLNLFYDNRFKWVVDFEFYMRVLEQERSFFYINKPLINVGIHPAQVTGYTFRKPEVELPENHMILETYGVGILKNIFVYDYFWRLYRNLGIRKVSDISDYYVGPIARPVERIMAGQKVIPLTILKIGVFSKLLMAVSYMKFRFFYSRKSKRK